MLPSDRIVRLPLEIGELFRQKFLFIKPNVNLVPSHTCPLRVILHTPNDVREVVNHIDEHIRREVLNVSKRNSLDQHPAPTETGM
jgi:hypothetical protein